MIIRRIEAPPTKPEIKSYTDAFSHAPWSEKIPDDEATDYLKKFREAGAATLGVFDSETEADPYMYVHFSEYEDVEQLVTDEFSGDEAFYVAENPEEVATALAGFERVCFISNIHADKAATAAPEHKPRIKAMGPAIEHCFEATGADCVALFTHRDTGVYSEAEKLELPGYSVHIQDYAVQPSQHNTIDKLALIIISPGGEDDKE